MLGILLAGVPMTVSAQTQPSGAVKKALTKPKPAAKINGDATVLTYRFKTGETHRYKIKAFFDGHFPPFAQPGSLPIHLMAEIVYVSKIGKQTAKGTEVSFNVDSADLSLLTHEAKLDEKISPDDQTPFPIALPDVQKALDTKAVIRPDGSIASVVSGNGNVVRVNIGFDLRKLFLLVMPITFPQKPIQPGATWPAQEGVLGTKPGSIQYTNNLVKIVPGIEGYDYNITQDASSKIDDTLDEQDNSTTKADAIFSTLKGDVTLDGNVTFSTPAKQEGMAANTRAGQMMHGMLHMQVNLQHKVTKKDVPAEIIAGKEGDIDVKARLLFRNDDAPAKSPSKTKKAGGDNVASDQSSRQNGGNPQ